MQSIPNYWYLCRILLILAKNTPGMRKFLALLLALACAGAQAQEKGPVNTEAREWSKTHPEKTSWKMYPSVTVDMLPSAPSAPDRLNRYGSLADGPQLEGTGFYRTCKYNGRWFFVDPEGRLHIDAGVVGIRQGGGETNKRSFAEKFADKQDWILKTGKQIASWGFSGAGAWSDDEAIRLHNRLVPEMQMSYCPFLGLMSGYGWQKKVARQLSGNTGYPNQCILAFDPGFEEFCEKKIAQAVARYKDDPNVLGYFSDNEMPLSKKNLEGYLDLPEDDFGRKAAEEWLRGKGIARDGITDELREEFAGFVAERYYSVVSKILKKYDPDHLYLGTRLHGGAKYIRPVYEAAGRWCDVISINYYGFWRVREKDVERWQEWADKPFIITEFYTKAEDSGLSNVTGAGWLVHTQKDRGIHYENFIIGLLGTRNCIGWSWFKYQDNDPTAKNVDPSNLNSNKGCFDNRYEPYEDLVRSMTRVNTVRYGLVFDFNGK